MSDTTRGLCSKCSRETDWSIGHEFYTDNFSGSVHIVHTFVCEECGIRVKERDWPTYQRFAKRRLTEEHKEDGDECETDL